ncbi:ArsR family transcriptional regulator [Paenibacillus swuensis]|uniref:ArsR family transcriptional regulator n=1 Tax=Paenibacillus swuensis TaxID=1178515 RepID=A0A172TL42_9BACL|nr:metalloregulator ArsR/SmtB family transcription factor [Paenibacillus swuensis]ANE47758.1 ArsR family transcriptional regulator [Paenibacillus swuensis]
MCVNIKKEEAERALISLRSAIPLFQALSDPARQDIILLLAERDAMTVGAITEQSQLSRPAISHHLKILRDTKLVRSEQKGTQRYYSLEIVNALDTMKALIHDVETACAP